GGQAREGRARLHAEHVWPPSIEVGQAKGRRRARPLPAKAELPFILPRPTSAAAHERGAAEHNFPRRASPLPTKIRLSSYHRRAWKHVDLKST
ncbi:hypothetical protein Dimus_016047, partial [Dionaea muscipula]